MATRNESRRTWHSPSAGTTAGVAAGLVLALTAGAAHAAVTVSRAELSGNRLRVEGQAAPSRTITVDGVAMGTSSSSGEFRLERSGYTPPADCTVDVGDGSASATTARLSGCTETTPVAPALSSLGLSDTEVVGGTPVTGTVRLTAAARTGGFLVVLSSTNTTAATVPADVVVPAGASSASFPVETFPVTNSQSATIVGEAGTVRVGSTVTVTTERDATIGSVSLSRGGTGGGRVTSSPAGIDCTFTSTGTTGTCGNAFFAAGTEVRLEARADANSKFLGWEFEVSCPDAPEVVVQAGVAHICRPVFARR